MPPLVLVEWLDAFSTHHWRNQSEYEDITTQGVLVRTAGYLLRRTPNVVVALSWQENDSDTEDRFNETMSIPKGMVRRIVPLRIVTKAR